MKPLMEGGTMKEPTIEEPSELVPRDQFIEQSQTAAEALVKSQIAARYAIARKCPRDIEVSRQRMLKECERPSFCLPDEKKNGSSVAIYRVPRGSGEKRTNIEGVTIRFAEMAMRAWGNLSIDIQPLGEDATQRMYLVSCTDYETNNFVTEIVNVSKTVERNYIKDTDTVISQRTNSYNKPVYTIIGTDDDLMMKRNACISKARRNLILQHIPGWLVEECIDQIQATAAKKDAEDPDAAKRQLFDAFAGVGVTVQMLNEFIGHTNPLSPAELEDLRGYFGAMREGYTTWAEIAASKGESHEDDTMKRIDALLAASGRKQAVGRKLKAEHIGRADVLLKFLEDEAAKKGDTGAAPAAASQQATTEEKKTAKTDPAPETRVPANLKPATETGVVAQTQRSNHSAPPPVSEDW